MEPVSEQYESDVPTIEPELTTQVQTPEQLPYSRREIILTILGIVIAIVGSILLVRLDVHSGYTELLVAMLVLGIGVGSGLAVYTVVVQNAYPQKIGTASSTLVFFRQLGGTIGLAA